MAIVTGGAGTLGGAVCRALLAADWRVASVDRDATALGQLVAAVGSSERAFAIQADVTIEDEAEACVGQILERWARIDGLVNNVGAEGDPAPIPEHSLTSFEATMKLNVTSMFLMLKHVLPVMAEAGGGSIVNMGSTSSLLGNPCDVAYTASKHAVVGLTRAAAAEWGHRGVRVNVICPSPVESPLMEKFERAQPRASETVRQWYTTQTPVGRYCLPEEVASVVLFLLSPAARFMNGATVILDGGLTASGRPAI